MHWQEKGYTNDEEWREFCNRIVPLAKFPKFVYADTDNLKVPVEVDNAYITTIDSVRSAYYISDDQNEVLAGGSLAVGKLPVGKNLDIGTVVFPLDKITKPTKLTLTVSLSGVFKNHWDFWVYPSEMRNEELEMRNDDYTQGEKNPQQSNQHSSFLISHSSLYVADSLDAKALDVLKKGGKVLLTAAGKVRYGRDVVQHYLPVF